MRTVRTTTRGGRVYASFATPTRGSALAYALKLEETLKNLGYQGVWVEASGCTHTTACSQTTRCG